MMRDLFHRLFDIRRGEGLKASLMFTYIFLIISSLMILKPVRDSLFLVKVGSEKLPHVYILMAIFGAGVASLLSKYSKKINLRSLILATLFVSVFCLLVFWVLLRTGYTGGGFLYAFYIWVGVFGVTTAAQFWILANYVYNAREAKRLFGFIGAGAIAGGIFGGYLTSLLAQRIRTENLVFFCMGFLLICSVLLWSIWKIGGRGISSERLYRERHRHEPQSTGNPIKLIFNSRHLTCLAGLIGVSVVVAYLVDFQFKTVAERAIPEADKLTSFFGLLMATLSIVSLGTQLLITNRIMKYFGVAVSLIFLPLGLLVGAGIFFLTPSLWSAIIIKFSDGSMKHSINRAGTELLALPIPTGIKNKAKAFIDVFIRNLAKGLGGALILLTIGLLEFGVQHISLIIIALIAFWMYLIFLVRREYINSFRTAIEKRIIQVEEQSLDLQDAAIFGSLLKVLDGRNERQILYVMGLLEDVKNKKLVPYLKKLIKHPSLEVKASILKMALQYEELDLSSEVKTLINSGDQAAQTAAIHYLCENSEDKISTLKTYLKHEEFSIRCAAMICASLAWKESQEFREEIDMKGLVVEMYKSLKEKVEEEKKEFIKINIAKILGEVNHPDLYPYIYMLLNDESKDVVKEAVVSAGRTLSQDFILILIKHLGTRGISKYARESLAEYGEDITDTLEAYLENPSEDKKIRLAIPRVLSLIESQKSITILTKNLDQRDLILRYQILKALNKLRVKCPQLKYDEQEIEGRIQDEIKQYNRNLTMLVSENNSLSSAITAASSEEESDRELKARRLLISALEEKLSDGLERIFRLLGLRYLPKDMYSAYLGVSSDKSILKADSIEFLDNVLDSGLKRILIPIIEIPTEEMSSRDAQNLTGFNIPTEPECIDFILQGDDNWLKVCTLNLVASINYRKSNELIAKLAEDSDHLVKETARYCLKRLGYPASLTVD